MQNETLIKAAKQILKDLLIQCNEEQQLLFKRMYSHKNLKLSIEEVVEGMDTEKMDWAITQTEATLKKENKLSIASEESIYVITNPENGWDCLVAVLSDEEKVKEWFKINHGKEVIDLKNHDQIEPYCIFKRKIE